MYVCCYCFSVLYLLCLIPSSPCRTMMAAPPVRPSVCLCLSGCGPEFKSNLAGSCLEFLSSQTVFLMRFYIFFNRRFSVSSSRSFSVRVSRLVVLYNRSWPYTVRHIIIIIIIQKVVILGTCSIVRNFLNYT
jgi:hypothetical protein